MWYDRIATPFFHQFPYLRERPIGRSPLPPPLIPQLLGPPMTRGTGVSRSFSLNKAMRCTTHHTVSWLFLTIDYEDASVNPITLGAKERRYWSVSYEFVFIYASTMNVRKGEMGLPALRHAMLRRGWRHGGGWRRICVTSCRRDWRRIILSPYTFQRWLYYYIRNIIKP